MTQRKHPETTAMDKILDALAGLDCAARCRVLDYVDAVYEDERAAVDDGFRWHTVSGTVSGELLPTDETLEPTTDDQPITVERRTSE